MSKAQTKKEDYQQGERTFDRPSDNKSHLVHDFMSDARSYGRKLRVLNIIDD
ncbi:MAG: hypothetical protein JXR65_07210 [Bacteroidales bacterium]|nr:hypothetical protein [Bacteroidales bacterium]